MTVLTDMKLSSTAAHAIAERTRFAVMDRFPNEVLDVLVGKTKYSSLFLLNCVVLCGCSGTDTVCSNSVSTSLSHSKGENNN